MSSTGCFSFFRFSGWVSDLDHLIALMNIMIIIQMIFRSNPLYFGDISGFVIYARKVFDQCKENSRKPSVIEKTEFHRMLAAISNSPTMRSILGHRPMIGGSYWNTWTTIKMYCFLMQVMRKQFSPFVHDHSYYSLNIRSSDLQNIGALYRDIIRQIMCNGGRLFEDHRAVLEIARNVVSTPRNQQPLNASSSSVGGSMSARTNISVSSSSFGGSASARLNASSSSFGGSASARLNASSSSFGGSETMPAPGSFAKSPRTPRELCNFPCNLLIQYFVSTEFEFFFQSLGESAKEIVFLNRLYELVAFYRRNYGLQLLSFPPLTKTFFKDLGRLYIIQQTLNDLCLTSLEIVSASQDRIDQLELIELLEVNIIKELWIECGGDESFMYESRYRGVWTIDQKTLRLVFERKVSVKDTVPLKLESARVSVDAESGGAA
jgi:hypothetical protein